MTDREKFLATIKGLNNKTGTRGSAGLIPEHAAMITILGIFADWLDEHDQPDLAYAYRWGSRHEHWPHCWNRFSGERIIGTFVTWRLPQNPKRKSIWPDHLPVAVFTALPISASGYDDECQSRDIDSAFRKLAKALKRLREVVSLDPAALH